MNTQQRKYLAIAAVVGLHAAVITFMLAQHGCKSGAAKTAAPTSLSPVPAPAPGPVADDDRGFYAPTPPPEIVRVPTPAPAPDLTPTPIAQYTEQLGPVTPAGPAPTPAAPMSVMYEVKSGDSWSSIAKYNHVSISDLVKANSPKYSLGTILQPKMQLKSPSAAAPSPTTVTATGDDHLYKVLRGDSLAKIASSNHTTTKAIQEANGMGTSTAIREGQMLKLPTASAAPATNPAAAATPGTGSSDGYYTVVPGDNPGVIAKKVGVSLKDLYASSGLNDTTAKSIRPGQKIKLPAGAHAPDATAPTPSADASPTTILTAVPASQPHITAVPAPSSSTGTSPPVTAITQ